MAYKYQLYSYCDQATLIPYTSEDTFNLKIITTKGMRWLTDSKNIVTKTKTIKGIDLTDYIAGLTAWAFIMNNGIDTYIQLEVQYNSNKDWIKLDPNLSLINCNPYEAFIHAPDKKYHYSDPTLEAINQNLKMGGITRSQIPDNRRYAIGTGFLVGFERWYIVKENVSQAFLDGVDMIEKLTGWDMCCTSIIDAEEFNTADNYYDPNYLQQKIDNKRIFYDDELIQ